MTPARGNTNAVQELGRIADDGRFGGQRGGPRGPKSGEITSLRLAARAGKAHVIGQPECRRSAGSGASSAEYCGRLPEGEIQR